VGVAFKPALLLVVITLVLVGATGVRVHILTAEVTLGAVAARADILARVVEVVEQMGMQLPVLGAVAEVHIELLIAAVVRVMLVAV
tara:strand:- start:1886 stop:2143 length:258 start_codon:yes stop_codon:yes gene_type:complete